VELSPADQAPAQGGPRLIPAVSLHPESDQLLRAIPAAIEGVSVELFEGAAPASLTADHVRVSLPQGELVAEISDAAPAHALVSSLLQAVAERERLESDMESMSCSAAQLMERFTMIIESLPLLSAGSTDHEIAALGASRCRRAAGVEQVVLVAGDLRKECCEVVVHDLGDEAPDDAEALRPLQPIQGIVEQALRADGVLLRSVPEGARWGEPGSVDHLARRQVIAAPVRYGAAERRVTLGVLLLIDRVQEADDAAGDIEPELGSEEAQVAESFASMLGAVLGARQGALLGKELDTAQAIQQQVLPDRPVELEGFDVAAGYFACGGVGGDYYDYVPLADGRTMVVVADVSGHSLASGMLMVGARAMLRTLATVHDRPEDVFTQFARRMHEDLTRTERFLTAAAVTLRPNGRAIEYVSAGHNDLMVYRSATDTVERCSSEDVIFGFVPEPEYRARQLLLEPGDCALLFTDGISEATDLQDEMFGEERLAAVFAQLAPNRSAERILDGVVAELDRFRRGQVRGDDVTAVVIRCTHGGVRP